MLELRTRVTPHAPRPPADALVGRTLASDVLHRLRSDIIDGVLRPGEPLRFQALRDHYGVSFGTLREALAHLVKEGLAVAEGQRGFRVAPISRADLLDVIAVDTVLERQAVALSIRNGGEAWERAVRDGFRRLDAARIEGGPGYELTAAWSASHREFHAALTAACGSPTLLEMRARLFERWHRYRQVLAESGIRLSRARDTHAALAEAALGRDAPRAMDLVEEQLRESAESIVAQAGEILERG